MKRKIIKVIEEKCNGCGLCINACHEGALQLIDGKAKLVSDTYCDGLGACLPNCPVGALEIIEREADDFDEISVNKNMNLNMHFSGCPSTRMRMNVKNNTDNNINYKKKLNDNIGSELKQWPCQIRLVPYNAPFLNNCNLLIAADCTAFAYPNIQEVMKDKITLIGCPKLDDVDYTNKLTEILKYNKINSVTVIRMEVPCCGGIASAVIRAIKGASINMDLNVITISVGGNVIE